MSALTTLVTGLAVVFLLGVVASLLRHMDAFIAGVIIMYLGMGFGLLVGGWLVVTLGFTSWVASLVVLTACLVAGFMVGMAIAERVMDGADLLPEAWRWHR